MNNRAEPDARERATGRLLTPAEAAALLGVSVEWVYRHHRGFTFSRKLSHRVLRFSANGLRDYIEHGRR